MLAYGTLFVLRLLDQQEALLRKRTTRRAISVRILSTAETKCTTNPQQIAVMELGGDSSRICSKAATTRRLSDSVASRGKNHDGDGETKRVLWLIAAGDPDLPRDPGRPGVGT